MNRPSSSRKSARTSSTSFTPSACRRSFTVCSGGIFPVLSAATIASTMAFASTSSRVGHSTSMVVSVSPARVRTSRPVNGSRWMVPRSGPCGAFAAWRITYPRIARYVFAHSERRCWNVSRVGRFSVSATARAPV